jgi:hypothetical protein
VAARRRMRILKHLNSQQRTGHDLRCEKTADRFTRLILTQILKMQGPVISGAWLLRLWKLRSAVHQNGKDQPSITRVDDPPARGLCIPEVNSSRRNLEKGRRLTRISIPQPGHIGRDILGLAACQRHIRHFRMWIEKEECQVGGAEV